MKRLKPLILKDKYHKPIEAEIARILRELIFIPLSKAIGEELRNAKQSVAEAILSGRIWQDGDYFNGAFNATLTKEFKAMGGFYDKRKKAWFLPRPYLPDVSTAIVQAGERISKLSNAFVKVLDGIDTDDINNISRIPDRYDETIDEMEEDYQKTIKSISVSPKLTKEAKGMITADWSYNLDLYVKKWAAENIIKMRSEVKSAVMSGMRANSLSKILMDNYGISKSKAKFLARQETSLLMSKFHESRLKDIGVTEYIWQAVMDERTRDDHKILDGKKFSFSSPPVVDRRTGRRANAGEDFGCRCLAVPFID